MCKKKEKKESKCYEVLLGEKLFPLSFMSKRHFKYSLKRTKKNRSSVSKAGDVEAFRTTFIIKSLRNFTSHLKLMGNGGKDANNLFNILNR